MKIYRIDGEKIAWSWKEPYPTHYYYLVENDNPVCPVCKNRSDFGHIVIKQFIHEECWDACYVHSRKYLHKSITREFIHQRIGIWL